MMTKIVTAIVKRILLSIPLALIFLILYNQMAEYEKDSLYRQFEEEHLIHLNYIREAAELQFDNYYSLLSLASDSVTFLPPPAFEGPPGGIHMIPPDMAAPINHTFNNILRYQQQIKHIILYGSEDDLMTVSSQRALSSDDFSLDHYDLSVSRLFNEVNAIDEQMIYLHPVTPVEDPATKETYNDILMAKGVYTDHRLEGVIVFIIRMNASFDMITDYFENHSDAISYCIVDHRGVVLDSSKKTLQITADNESISLATLKPEVWVNMLEQKEGAVRLEEKLFLFTSTRPLEEFSTFYESIPHYLLIITSFDLDEMEALKSSFILRNDSLRYVIAMMIMFGYVVISLLFYFRKNDQELLTVSNIINEQSHDGVLIRKPDGTITFCNNTIEVLTGFNAVEISDHSVEITLLDGNVFYSGKDKMKLLSSPALVNSYDDFAWVSGKNYYILSHLYMDSVYNNHSDLLYYVQLISDPLNISKDTFDSFVLDSREMEIRIDRFPIEKITGAKDDSTSMVIMYLKLTNLDTIETNYTHSQHYQLVAIIRDRLLSLTGKNDMLFQYSPEIYMLAFSIDSQSVQKKIIELNSLLAEPVGLPSQEKQILSFMCGVSVGDRSQELSVDHLINRSRMALATQIHFEREGALIYSDSISKALVRYYEILRKIPEALKNGDFEIYFQPIISTSSKKIIGAEALSRWTDGDLGFISPNEFIPIFMNHRLEVSLALFVIEKTVKFLSSLELDQDERFTVSINLGPSELFEENLIDHLVTTLDAYNVDHSRLFIELTERTLLEDFKKGNMILEKLHKEGIRIAIDDFGTGFSSLNYIHSLDIDLIKIDRSFIKDYPHESEGKIIKAILTMAREIEISTLVEGIETEQQLEFITEHGAKSYQGFLVSKALPVQQFIQFFREQTSED